MARTHSSLTLEIRPPCSCQFAKFAKFKTRPRTTWAHCQTANCSLIWHHFTCYHSHMIRCNTYTCISGKKKNKKQSPDWHLTPNLHNSILWLLLRPLISHSLRRKLWSSRLDAGCLCQIDPSWINSFIIECQFYLCRAAPEWRNYVTMFFKRGEQATSMQQDGGSTQTWFKSAIDHSDLESNWHRHPLGNLSPAGRLCQLDLSFGDLTNTYIIYE